MHEKFRFGILGAARIARISVAPAINVSRVAEFCALSTQNIEKAAAFYPFASNLKLYDDYSDLLADPSLDGVYIPLPNHLHVDWSLAALAAGKHVLCEKPIAMSAQDFVRLDEARSCAGRHLAEGLMAMHHPQWQRVREIIEAGSIGRLRSVDAIFSFNNSDPKNIRNRPETGGGAMRDLGVYPLALTRAATGLEPLDDPECISVQSKIENGVDIESQASIAFSGFKLDFRVSMRRAPRQEMVFHGSKGWLRLAAPFTAHSLAQTSLELFTGSVFAETEFFDDVDQYQLMIEAFVREARNEVPPLVSMAFSRQNQKIVDRVLLSIGVH